MSRIVTSAKRQKFLFVANLNTHSAYLFHKNRQMASAMKSADITFIDSFPILYWGKLLGHPLKTGQRTTGLEFLRPLLAKCQHEGLRVYFVGGKPAYADLILSWVRRQFPGLVFGLHHGYLKDSHDAVLDDLNRFAPDLILAGMGMPRQEIWIQRHRTQLPPRPVVALGATFEYYIGAQNLPPRWLGPLCLEGFFRLLSQPRRLWRRYLLYPWLLLPVLGRDIYRASLRPASNSSKADF